MDVGQHEIKRLLKYDQRQLEIGSHQTIKTVHSQHIWEEEEQGEGFDTNTRTISRLKRRIRSK